MISIYEAVVQPVQQSTKPVQAPGAVVPKPVQPQQQAQPAQVPAQPAADAQQQATNAGQINSASQPQQQIQPTDPLAQPTDKWKKYLKNAALIGAGLGAGGLLYYGGTHWNDITNAMSKWLPGSSVPTPDDSETAENDNSSTEATTRVNTNTGGNRSVSGVRTIYRPAPMIGPRSTPTVDPATYAHHMPQPANSRSWLDQMTGRRGYISNGYGGRYGYGWYNDGEWAENNNYHGGSFSRSHVPAQPITDYDLGRRSRDFNGA